MIRPIPSRSRLALALCVALAPASKAQPIDPKLYAEMHWRQIGPPRAGRARALSGVPSQPNVFYIGFDNGGVWRSTDYGSTWQPLFDTQSTGSIGAIAVAPSDPSVWSCPPFLAQKVKAQTSSNGEFESWGYRVGSSRNNLRLPRC